MFSNLAIRLGEYYAELVNSKVPNNLAKAVGFFYKY